MNESIACYDQSLYLAAVSTAGTTLENLIVLIIEKENKYNDNINTQLGELAGRLHNTGLVDRRGKERIMLAAKFRNLASHANKGRVAREDAKLVYQTIFNLADNFLIFKLLFMTFIVIEQQILKIICEYNNNYMF